MRKVETTSVHQTSPGVNNSNIEDNTSSNRADVKRAVIRPMPLAADQRTTVSYT